jgi:hypothetical protein
MQFTKIQLAAASWTGISLHSPVVQTASMKAMSTRENVMILWLFADHIQANHAHCRAIVIVAVLKIKTRR